MLNKILTHLEYCTFCPKMCRHACPVANASGRETFIPQAKMAGLGQVRRGNEPWTRETTEPLWACTGCAHCTSYCVHGVEPGATLLAGRAEATRRGVGHPTLHLYPERFRAREERLVKRARELFPKSRFATEANVGLWLGCDMIDKGGRDALATLALIDSLGERHVRLVTAERICGGYPLLVAGYPDAFRWHALRVASELVRYRTVVMSCSACVYVMRTLYPREGINLTTQILHITEYLRPFISRIAEPLTRGSVYYHDPCYLSRHLNVIEAPRELLARVANVREFVWSRGDSECCGGGGLLPKTMPTTADDMAKHRLREVAQAGGGTVVTSCATCKHMLARNAPPGVLVRDLVEFVNARGTLTSRAAL